VKRAVVYCRVSTKDQVANLSLPTQEKACREWCAREGAEVVRVFVDAGESAKTADRPAFNEALEYCRSGNKIGLFVVYALSRFARSSRDHANVAARLKASGVSLRSVTEPIDDTATGKLMETMLAGFAQFDNDVRADRTRAGMRAAIEAGRWVYRAPLGYLPGMRPDPDRAPLIAQAFILAADWTGTTADLRREVGRLGLTTRSGRPVPGQTFWRMLRSPVYAGILRAPGLEARGNFTALVDEETFYRAQAGMSGKAPKKRQRVNAEFPLRGFVRCGPCGRALTAYFARGKSGGRFPYYRCSCNRVSVRREVLEAAFVELLDRAAVPPEVLEALRGAVLAEWADYNGRVVESRERRDRQLAELRRKKSRLVDGYLAQDISPDTYREKLAEFEDAIAAATAAALSAAVDEDEVAGALAFAAGALASPGRAWLTFAPEARRGFAALVFEAPPAWVPGEGFTNPQFSPVFNGLRGAADENGQMVALPGQFANPVPAVFALWEAVGRPTARPA